MEIRGGERSYQTGGVIDGIAPEHLRVLVVDDHPELAAALEHWFQAEVPGWSLDTVDEPETALATILRGHHDVVLLDTHLACGRGGIAVCQRVRTSGCSTPIIVLTVAAGLSDRVRAFDAGASEYLVKGETSMRELVTRVQLVFLRHRRHESAAPASEPVAKVGPIAVNLVNHGIVVGGRVLELPKHQRRLLVRLAHSLGETVSHEELCRAAEISPGVGYKNLHNEVLRLRRLLGREAAVRVGTVRSTGYRLS